MELGAALRELRRLREWAHGEACNESYSEDACVAFAIVRERVDVRIAEIEREASYAEWGGTD